MENSVLGSSESEWLTGLESLKGDVTASTTMTVLDFWRWAFSDLRDNTLRGIFAEWLVANLLGLQLQNIRRTWDTFDLDADGECKIEVKNSAYIQSWNTESTRLSKIQFTGLKSRKWTPENGYEAQPDYHGDIYIFCLQIAKKFDEYDILNLAQWEFYVLPRYRITATGLRSIGLSSLQRMTSAISAEYLRSAFDDALLDQRTRAPSY